MDKSFKFKKIFNVATAIGLIGSAGFAEHTSAAVTFYTADATNTSIQSVGLNQPYLGNGILANPSTLAPGSVDYNYAAVTFTATEDGTYKFGQTYSPVDTIMILYSGVYDPTHPGTGALVGNDDTSQSDHQAAIGSPVITSCWTANYCPQVTWSVTAGMTYTLFVSVFNAASYNSSFTIPFDFYSTGDVTFNTYTGRTPIDMAQPFYLGSELGVTVDPIFVGGTLKADMTNGTYAQDFTLSRMASNTIDQNGNNSTFSGVFSDATSGQPGLISIDNSGSGGSVTFSGLNTYTGATVLKGGTLIVSQDANLGGAAAHLVFNGGTLQNSASFDSARAVSLLSTGTINVADGTTLGLSGVVSGIGGWTKDGAGTLVLGADNTYSGATHVAAGTLQIGDAANTSAALSGGTAVAVDAGATLGGYGSITGSVTNNGVFAVGPALATLASGPQTNFIVNGDVTNNAQIRLDGRNNQLGNTLTVNGNYAGNAGELVMNTVLGDDSSATDQLIISGNATGTTKVTVNNIGGLGAKTIEGIELIKVQGTSDDNAFVQNGRIVAGAYDYTLVKGSETGSDANDWYLTSKYIEPYDGGGSGDSGRYNVRAEAGSYIANLATASSMFNLTLHDRLGETQYTDLLTGEKYVTSVWMRGDAGRTKSTDSSNFLDTTTNRNIIQIGGDIATWNTAGDNRFHVGVMGGYGNSDSDTTSGSGKHSSGKVEGYSAGIYGTWYKNNEDKSGPYVDTWLMWNDMDAKVQSSGVKDESYNISGLNASVEAGYSFKVGQTKNFGVWVQPQAQVTWMGTKADDHVDHYGVTVKGNDNNLQTRVGVRGYLSNNQPGNTSGYAIQPYAEVNWIHNSDPYGITMNETGVDQAGASDVGEVKLGLESNLNKHTSVWVNVGYQQGSDSYSDVSARAGVKYSF